MPDENNDANTGEENAAGADSSSDAVEIKPMVDDDGLVSTVEYQQVEKEVATDEDTDDVDNSDDAEQNTSEDQPSEKQDFHEHPRFKELITKSQDQQKRIDELEAQIAETSKSSKDTESQVPSKDDEAAANFRNIMAMKDDDIVEEVTNNPKAFFANLANQIAHELRMDQQATENARQVEAEAKTHQEKVNATVQSFFKDKEDGQAMLKDGRIKAFIAENPGHNEISAYHALAGEANQKSAIESAVEEAVKKTEERIYKEFKARGKAKSAATSTGGRTLLNSDKSPEMKDPDKFGGTENVLLQRHLARQSSN